MSQSDRNTEVTRCRPELEPLEDRYCPAVAAVTAPDAASNTPVAAAPLDAATANTAQLGAAAAVANASGVAVSTLNTAGVLTVVPTTGPPINSPEALIGRQPEPNNLPRLTSLRFSQFTGTGDGGAVNADAAPARPRQPGPDDGGPVGLASPEEVAAIDQALSHPDNSAWATSAEVAALLAR